jgi:ferric-dicitrate binding protein FerR (iron transport regulator)
MSEFKHTWADLLEHYIKGNITPDELEELNRQRASSVLKQQQFIEYTNPNQVWERLSGIQTIDTAEGWQKLVALYPPLSAPVAIPFYKRSYFIRSFAAAVLFIIAVVTWLLVTGNGEQQDYPYLVLANGNRINLKNAPNGIITDDPKVQIVKQDGLLIVKQKLVTKPGEQPGYHTLFNAGGGNYEVELSDGTHVKLNAATRLKFPGTFVGNNRQVEASGQAFFTVSDYHKIPFTVLTTADTQIKVLGTEFDLSAYEEDDQVTITLLKGFVTVNKGSQTFRLEPGQQFIAGKQATPTVVNGVNAQHVTAWTQNRFDFEGATVQEATRQLGRYYNLGVEFKGTMPHSTFSGSFNRSQARDSILSILKESYQVNIQPTDKKLVVNAIK